LIQARDIYRSGSIAVVLICGWVIYVTSRALHNGFHPDDITNLYRAWEQPVAKLLAANLVPFTTVYRPLGSLYYLSVYSMWGLDPWHFRLFTYSLAIVNVMLVYVLARRLFHRLDIAALSALVFSMHPRMLDIYQNNGTIYDILCCTFVLLAVIVYHSSQRSAGSFNKRAAVLLFACVLFAVNSKEIGLALPFVLAAYEIAFRAQGVTPAFDRSLRPAGAWLLVLTVIACLAANAKTGPGSALHGHIEYSPDISVHKLGDTLRLAMEALLDARPDSFTERRAWTLLALFTGAVLLSRDWRVIFLFAAAFLSAVPALFITWRGLFVFYVPYAFLSIALCALGIAVLEALLRLLPLGSTSSSLLRGALVTGVAVLVMVRQSRMTAELSGPVEQHDIARLSHQVRKATAAPPGRAVLFLNGKAEYEWLPLMLARMSFNSPALQVHNQSMGQCVPQFQYDLVIDLGQFDHVIKDRQAPGSRYCVTGR
jgi:hypothetical protein